MKKNNLEKVRICSMKGCGDGVQLPITSDNRHKPGAKLDKRICKRTTRVPSLVPAVGWNGWHGVDGVSR
jgi:hypothetical protein